MKSPLNLNHRIGKGLKQSALITANTPSQRGNIQKNAYGTAPKPREIDQDFNDRASMTVFRIQESSTTLIDNALGKTESDADVTNTSKTLDKG